MLALQAGDDAALNELMARHREALHRFVYRYVRDETEAADIVQETFVRVYFKASRYRPQSSVKTWIYTIAVNLCRDRFRKRAAHPEPISLDQPAGREGEAQQRELPDALPSPQARAVQNDRLDLLRRAIDRLPEKLRTPLLLFCIEGHSQKDTADILETTPKTIELRVYRAKEKLRSILSSWQEIES